MVDRLNITFFYSRALAESGILDVLSASETLRNAADDGRYSSWNLIRRLSARAWRFRADCLWSLVLSLVLLLLSIAGLNCLGVVIDVIRQALDPALPRPVSPYGWQPPATWPAVRMMFLLSGRIITFSDGAA